MKEKIITAEELAKDMREISVAEFFERNKHFLGYENPTKGLLTVVKEAVDNSLEFSTEAGILPEVKIKVKQITEDRFKVLVEDNGPGIVKEQLPRAFAKVLYGSRFHTLKQSRSLFGIGIKGACLYSQLTTGKPIKVESSSGKGPTHIFELMIDVAKNEPKIISHATKENPSGWRGIKIEMEVEGRYISGGHSISNYLKQTAMANPFAKISFDGPDGKIVFKRVTRKLPPRPKEIKPHPYGVEIGILRRMLAATKAKNIVAFLNTEFSRVGKRSAQQMCKKARIEFDRKPQSLTMEESEKLYKAVKATKLMAPPTNCLSPLGEELLIEGLKKETGAEHVVAVTRTPTVYKGHPFEVEVALGYGGSLPEESALLFRFANKVPLFYHQGDCVITEAVKEVDWHRYGISQSKGQLPGGPLAILVHFASVWVPFTSEGKQAIACYPEILKEIKLALQDAGRELARYIRKKAKLRESMLRREIFERYSIVVAESLAELTEKDREDILKKLLAYSKSNLQREDRKSD
ncbi:MAG: DNA topoisomerase VI subunit B [Candidatus Aenigmarchaeota archaeon]|nr:DNA topoisomerase VI subunit B [Candidatus Aenigmarchaeota archaeon]